MARIKALYSVETSDTMHRNFRHECFNEALKLAASASSDFRFKEFGHGQYQSHLHEHLGLFSSETDEAIILSTDGAQLVAQRESDCWLVILSFLNVPTELRSKKLNLFICSVIPGPKSPGDLESFLYPIYQELAETGQGCWVWSGVQKEWFLYRAHLVAIKADMLGATKLNKMTGHQGFRGCKVCLMAGCLSMSKRCYYFPLRTVGKELGFNLHRPDFYDPLRLPNRNNSHWQQTARALSLARGKDALRIQKETGWTGVPLAAFSAAFSSPVSWPVDYFHLYFADTCAHIWDTITIDCREGDPRIWSLKQRQDFGQLVALAAKDLPTAFVQTAPRDIHLKRNTQYKVHEWASIFLYYLLPYFLTIDCPAIVIDLLATFINFITLSLNPKGLTGTELLRLRHLAAQFCVKFELYFVRNNLTHVDRARLVVLIPS